MDIVDDLRDLNSMHTPKEVFDIGEKAADEIERLRQKHKEMVSKLKYVVNEYNGLLEEHNQLLAKALGEKK
jgi:DNA-directed RNA polymerase specialized sigma subunit